MLSSSVDFGRDCGFEIGDRAGRAKGLGADIGDFCELALTGALGWAVVNLVILLWLVVTLVVALLVGFEGATTGRLGITVSRFDGFGTLSISKAFACFLFRSSSSLRLGDDLVGDGLFATGFARGCCVGGFGGALLFDIVAVFARSRGAGDGPDSSSSEGNS